MNNRILLIFCLVILGANCMPAQEDPLAAVRRSHIEANVPDEKDFHTILQRDLTKYVTDAGDKDVSVQIELLRKEPSQAGVALPKFYVWLEKLDSQGKVVEEAAVLIAAVEKKRFDVVQYFKRDKILADPVRIAGTFPKDVHEKIMQKVQRK